MLTLGIWTFGRDSSVVLVDPKFLPNCVRPVSAKGLNRAAARMNS